MRNREDGNVELVACGEDTNLGRFEMWLREGPTMAWVKSVKIEVMENTEHFTAFSIR